MDYLECIVEWFKHPETVRGIFVGLVVAVIISVVIHFGKIIKLSFYVVSKGFNSIFGELGRVWQRQGILDLIGLYRLEIERVERIHLRDKNEVMDLIEFIYQSLLIIIALIITYIYAVNQVDNIVFYSILGFNTAVLLWVVPGLIGRSRLIEKSRNFEKYKRKTNNKIELLEKLISKAEEMKKS